MARITIRLTDAERQALESDAEVLGLTMGSIVKMRAFGDGVKVTRKPSPQRIEVARFIGVLGAIGNNVNQIAKRLNQGGGLDDRRALGRMQTDLAEMRKAVVAAIHGEGQEPRQ